MVSLPSCRSCFRIQSKLWTGWVTTRETPPNVAAGHAETRPLTRPGSGTSPCGLPPEMPKGPNLVRARTAWFCTPVGKQAARAAKPAGVGVRLLEEKTLLWETIWLSNPPKKNSLFLIQGPPMVNPENSLFSRGGLVRQLGPGLTPSAAKPQIWGFFWKLVREFKIELFSAPKMLPCQALVPDLVMMFTTEPELRPYSGPNWLLTRTYWATNSESVTKSPGPPTVLSFWFSPGICGPLVGPRIL